MVSVDQERLEKIAHMEMLDIPRVQIASAIGVSEGRITQICDSAPYKEVALRLITENFEQQQTMNDGWDTIEAQALAVVLDRLKYTKDADFALKAAIMSNKAHRRGSKGNRPIDAGLSPRAVINLSAHFVQKIQQINIQNNNAVSGNGQNGNKKVIEHKRVDIMSPDAVEKLLSIESFEQELARNSFDEAIEDYFGIDSVQEVA